MGYGNVIVADPSRKYSKRGKRWSHLCSLDVRELETYAKEHGLKRKDRSPWVHYDVTDEELERLPDITRVTAIELIKMMRHLRQPRKSR